MIGRRPSSSGAIGATLAVLALFLMSSNAIAGGRGARSAGASVAAPTVLRLDGTMGPKRRSITSGEVSAKDGTPKGASLFQSFEDFQLHQPSSLRFTGL